MTGGRGLLDWIGRCLLFLGESTPTSKDNREVRQMHSPSSILPYFYAAIVKAGSLIKTKETHSMPEKETVRKKRETSLEYCCVPTFFLD
jgi:hypothetical protein